MQKPNIVFTSGMFPPAIGGPSKIVERLAKELTDKEYHCTVVTFGEDDGIERPYHVERVSFATNKFLRLFKTFLATWKYAKDTDVIYTLDTYTHGLTSAIVSKLLRKPLIVRFTGDSAWETAFNNRETTSYITDFQKQKHNFKTRAFMFRRNLILQRAEKIITDCDFLRELLKLMDINVEKVTVINNTVDFLPQVDFDHNTFKKENHLKENIIMTMGRLVPWKGYKAIIKIMPQILERFPEATFAIVGDGPQMDDLKELTKQLELNNTVRFFGKVTDKTEKSKIYSVSDIFILNTFYEGMSNTLLEAMGARKPIIATKAGGNEEFVNSNNGILVEYDSKEQIKDALLQLLADKNEQREKGEHGYQDVLKYTWDALIEKNVKLIDSICQK
ncbi:MAG: hypothetical protein COW93_02370 [Parcubacteria group bacterium CG22_combo_CG10-13_8_21_14_all_41_9]|nr:MAG: hypothetical protein COW93_02370 [Parcubacteria group bacterium CG22_combo_CG10-13_8_21_14_all_41_9]